jgi:hypothetical protein
VAYIWLHAELLLYYLTRWSIKTLCLQAAHIAWAFVTQRFAFFLLALEVTEEDT